MKDKESKRVAVYIDGSNLYYKLKNLDIKDITYFQYGSFSGGCLEKEKL